MVEFIITIALLGNPNNDRADAAAHIAIAAISPVQIDADEDTNPPPKPKEDVPRVQLTIYSGKTCPPCRDLKADIKKKLIEDQIVAGKQPWKVGEENSDLIRYIYDDKHPEEFRKRGITAIPHLIWVVDGKETQTNEHDPVKLAKEYYRKMEGLK